MGDNGVTLDRKVSERLAVRTVGGGLSISEADRQSFFFRYACSKGDMSKTVNHIHDRDIISCIQMELSMEIGDMEAIRGARRRLDLTCGDLVNNYDYPEAYDYIYFRDLGPTKPKMLRRFLQEKPNGTMEAITEIMGKLSGVVDKYNLPDPHADGYHLDPYDEEVFTFLSGYVRGCLEGSYTDIDSALGLHEGTLYNIANNAVKYGKVKILEWILTTFPRGERIGHNIPQKEIPVSSRLVLKRYSHPPFIPFGYVPS